MVYGLPALLFHTLAYAVRKPIVFTQGVRLLLSRFSRAPKKHTWLKHFMQGCYLANKARALNIVHTHCHFAHTPTSVGMYAALLLEQNFSFSAHAKDIYTEAPARTAEKLDRAAFAVTCTQYNTEFLRSLEKRKKESSLKAASSQESTTQDTTEKTSKVDCVYHGIDLSLFDGNNIPHTAIAPYHIMTVARFVEKKGIPYILHALKQLKDEGLRFRYSLIGDGKHRAKTEALIHELDLKEVIDLPGTIPHEKVLEYYRSADVFVLGCIEASDGDRDGIPNVIAESMAMGVPVVATDVSGIPELVENNVTGISVAQRDADALAQAIRRTLTDNSLREQIIPAARTKVEDVFDNRKLIKRLAEIFVNNGLPKGETH